MIGKALVNILLNTSAITAIVGTKIFPIVSKETVQLPCITFEKISGSRVHRMEGASRLALPVYQIDAYASTYAQVDTLADKIRTALNGYKGTVSSVNINGIILQDEEHIYEEEAEVFRVSFQFRIWHNET